MHITGAPDHITGDFTSILVIIRIAESNKGRYEVSNGCGQALSGAAPLTVGTDCRADFNCDGFFNSQDFFDFIAAFFALQPAADVNADGFINSQDCFDFLAALFAGC